MQSKQSIKPIWVIICFTFLLTSIPYFCGYLFQGDEQIFSGFIVDIEDGNAYLSKMISGLAGDWLHTSKYTTIPQTGLMIHIPYLLLGKLAGGRAIHDQLIALFHFYRFIALSVYCFGLYSFLNSFLQKKTSLLLGIMLVIWGGGLGWLFILPGFNQFIDYVPLEFYTPEAFSFLAVLAFPHIIMARGMMLFGVSQYLSKKNDDKVSDSNWKTGLLLWIAGLFQPLNAAIGVMVVLISEGVSLTQLRSEINIKNVIRYLQQSIKHIVGPVIGGGFWLVYMLWISRTDPYYISWSRQNQFYTPGILEMVIAYGLIGIYILAKINKMRIANNYHVIMLICWILMIPILILIPSELQRRFMEGSWVAWIAVGMVAYETTQTNLANRISKLMFGFYFISSIIFLVILTTGVVQKNQEYYLDRRVQSAYIFLADGGYEGNILASYRYGNQIPAWTKLTSVAGLKPETIALDDVLLDIDHFYQLNTTEMTRMNIIQKYKVDFVFSDRSLPTMSCAQIIYDQNNIQILDTRGCLQ